MDNFGILVSLLAISCVSAAATPVSFVGGAANATAYIVTGQWDGRTVPTPQWAFDITRQTLEFALKEELQLEQLIPTTPGDGLSPQYSSYDASTRSYFMVTARNAAMASLWAYTLAGDVSSASPLPNWNGEVRFMFPEEGATLVGVQAFPTPSYDARVTAYKAQTEGLNVGAAAGAHAPLPMTVLAFFNTLSGNCTVVSIDYSNGATEWWANLCPNNFTRQLTTAIEPRLDAGLLYVVTTSAEGMPEYEVLSVDIATAAYTSSALGDLQGFQPNEENPFEMTWLPAPLNVLLVFFTGNFDQMVYWDPTGAVKPFYAINNLAEYQGSYGGNLEFTADPFLEDDDLWSNSAYDATTNKLYFQCSDVDPDSGDTTTALCQLQIPPKTPAPLFYVNIAVEPMTYGYVGMQFVHVVSDKQQ